MLHFLMLAGSLIFSAPNQPLNIPFEKYVVAENGLEVILAEDHSLPLVAIDIWYHAGPINEPPKRTGFAHLFEHLMFQGSKHVADDEHLRLLESRGASFFNATTDFDYTNYLETLPASELELALWLESDRMGFLAEGMSQAKLDNQRQVVMNERRQNTDDRPYGLSHEKMFHTLFAPTHPYYGSVIGSMDDLTAASLDDVRDFYRDFYAPSNATLVIAGDFDPTRAKELVARYFASLPPRETPKTPQIATTPLSASRRATVAEHVPLPGVMMSWLSAPIFQPGDAEADMLAGILGYGEASRLYRHLVYDREWVQDIGVWQQSLMLTGIFTIKATAREGVDIARIEAEIFAQISKLASEGPTEEELTRVRNQIKTGRMRLLQRIGGLGGKADMLNHYNQFAHHPGYLAQDLARYDHVTPQDVANLARILLQPATSAVVVTVPK